ncbi:putative efflux transporter [Desarmillaria tabescens]|uniref:Efflux transporter n=1 Tax=Armillaria tabescens TaxID=1929756 RepID=A0AA39NRC0_ARMTA|nr:putative efflux transporter [Desarmillaria tabescens]KAK0470437.1 putative efflux transporter [Desarmillaria tabescens]
MFTSSPHQKKGAVNFTASESRESLASGRTAVRSVSIVLACMMAHIVNSSNTSAVSVSLPTIGKELSIPETRLNWIVSSGPLTTSCFLMTFGRICDLYGRKKPFLLGSLWMAVFTLSLSFAKNDITFDILRGLQGIGRAAMMPAAVGILSDAFPSPQARRKAFAAFTAGQPLGDALGTVVGGVLTQLTATSWRSPFYLISALTTVTFALGLYAIDNDRPSIEPDRRIDWLGTVLVSAGLLLVVFVLSQGEVAPYQWKTSYIITLLFLGITFIIAFFLWQRYLGQKYDMKSSKRYPPPLMQLSLWTRANGRVAAAFVIAFLTWCALYSWLYWAQLYYQNYQGLAPLATVTRLLPAYFTGTLYNVTATIFLGRIPLVYLMVSGNTLTAIASLLFALVNPNSVYFAFGFPAAILAPAGAGFVYACTMIYVTKVAKPHEQSMVGAVVQTMTQLGSSLGVTLSTVIFDQVSGGQAKSQRSPLYSYKAAEWTNFTFAALGMFSLSFWMTAGDRSDDILAALLALIVFRGVGVIEKGSRHCNKDESESASSSTAVDSGSWRHTHC